MQYPKQLAIQKGFQLIQDAKGYSQVKVVKKLNQLGIEGTSSSFNKILKNKKIGLEILVKFLEGMKLLLSKEIGFQLLADFTWEQVATFEPEEIRIPEKGDMAEKLVFHREGRLDLEEKVAFFTTAQKQFIEVGTTLNSFSEYLLSRRAAVFKIPIQNLLEKGVNVQCYLLDPAWNGTHFYFEDRNSPLDRNGTEKILNSLRKLKIVATELEALNLKGKFEVFTYRHFPHNYFSAIDLEDKKLAKMMISNYLYAIKRADCPVIEFSRVNEPTLFIRYKDSLKKLIKGAKKVDFSQFSD